MNPIKSVSFKVCILKDTPTVQNDTILVPHIRERGLLTILWNSLVYTLNNRSWWGFVYIWVLKLSVILESHTVPWKTVGNSMRDVETGGCGRDKLSWLPRMYSNTSSLQRKFLENIFPIHNFLFEVVLI